jgi:hypothetical protein
MVDWLGDPESTPCEMGGGPLVDYGRVDARDQGAQYLRRATRNVSCSECGRVYRTNVQKLRPPVYAVVDNCPAEWGGPRTLAVFAVRKDAAEFMLREKGKRCVKNQYLEIQRWRVR